MPSLQAPTVNLFASSLPSFSLFRRRKQSYELNPPEETHQVIYLGNVLTIMGKGEASVDKPLNVIWRTWNAKRVQRQPIGMRLSVTRSGLKAETNQLGLTEYWAHRITFCMAPPQYPRLFCWVYKHEGKRMKPELRCHAVLCKRASEPVQLSQMLNQYLQAALQEYKREKLAAERTRKHSVVSTCPKRKMLLQTGTMNFRPPVSRSRSVPRLGSIDEDEEEIEQEKEQKQIQQTMAHERLCHHGQHPQSARFYSHEHTEQDEVEDEEMLRYEDGEEGEDFSDLDAHSLHYRNTPVLSGDSSSQQSTSSGSSITSNDKRQDPTVDEEENDENIGENQDSNYTICEDETVHRCFADLLLHDEEEGDSCFSTASTSSQESTTSSDSSSHGTLSPPNVDITAQSPSSTLLLVIPPRQQIPPLPDKMFIPKNVANRIQKASIFSMSAPPTKNNTNSGGLRYRFGAHIWPFYLHQERQNKDTSKNRHKNSNNAIGIGACKQRQQTILVIGQ